jgi:hypothetical protein
MKSRFQTRGIGAQVFTTTTPPTCPPGQYWVPDPAVAIRGTSRAMASCQPVKVVHLTLRPPVFVAPPTTTAIGPPLPPPPITTPIPGGAPNTVTVYPAPPQLDPVLPPALIRVADPVCPPLWPWWWLLVAAAAGAGAGYLIKKDKKGAKKNAGRVLNAVGSRVLNRAVSRIV